MENTAVNEVKSDNFKRTLNVFDATAIVTGAMIGSGIFIVSAQIARDVNSPALLLLTWLTAGVMAIMAALTYGEFAASWPDAGGQYVYIKRIWGEVAGFVYGWSLFLVIHTGTIAAVSVAFSKFAGVLFPFINSSNVLLNIFGVTLTTQKLLAIITILGITILNARGVKEGALTQNIFTVAKILALVGIIICGITLGMKPDVIHANFSNFFTLPDLGGMSPISAVAVAMVGAIFAADSWYTVTFIAGEIKRPERNIPMSLMIGTGMVILLYLLTNFAYLSVLTVPQIQKVPDDIVGAAFIQALLGSGGQVLIAIIILVSAFGCLNGLVLTGARVYYAMAKDGLFFKKLAVLGEKSNTPENSLYLQCLWSSLLVMSGSYSQLLEYEIFAALLFYIFVIAGIFVFRKKYPDIPRPYKALGYPVIPVIYCLLAATVAINLLIYRPNTTWPGLLIIMTGLPVYLFWKKPAKAKLEQEPSAVNE